jgi:hypothetical protein
MLLLQAAHTNNQIAAQMTVIAFHKIAQIETSLWEAADQLRANSNRTASEYSMPPARAPRCGTGAGLVIVGF